MIDRGHIYSYSIFMIEGSRTQRRRIETRRRIVEAAVTLFETQGFDATTVEQITEAADIGKGTFFTHFPTKEGVFSYLSEHVLELMLEADDPALPAELRMRQSFAAAATWFTNNEVISRQMVVARLRVMGKTPASAERLKLLEHFTKIARSGLESGQWRSIPTTRAAQGLASCYFAAVALWALEPEVGDLQTLFDFQLDLLFNGLRKR